MPTGKRQPLDEARRDGPAAEEAAGLLVQEINESEYFALRKDRENLLDHAFGAGVDEERIGDERYSHEGCDRKTKRSKGQAQAGKRELETSIRTT